MRGEFSVSRVVWGVAWVICTAGGGGGCGWRVASAQSCSFDASNTASVSALDLSSVSGKRLLLGRDATEEFAFFWTPCSDNIECTGNQGTFDAMIAQSNQNNGKCNVVSEWDETIQPTYSDGIWTFVYSNGADCDGSPRQGTLNIGCGTESNYTGMQFAIVIATLTVRTHAAKVDANSVRSQSPKGA